MDGSAAGRSQSPDSMRTLAAQGSWRAILELQTKRRASTVGASADTPSAALSYAAWHVLALSKLRMFAVAADELAILGDLDAPRYRIGEKSVVPFALRFLAAELPYHTGHGAAAVDALYRLLDRCTTELQSVQPAQATGVPVQRALTTTNSEIELGDVPLGGQLREDDFFAVVPSPAGEGAAVSAAVALWRRRQATVMYALAAHHLLHKDCLSALRVLDRLLAWNPRDPALLTKAALVQLQMGAIEAARVTFAAADEAAASGELASSPAGIEAQQLTNRRCRGLLKLAVRDTPGALMEMEAVAAAKPADAAAVNNRALCLMFAKDVGAAIKVLERGLQASPATLGHEALITNLASMYELSSQSAQESKLSLSTFIQRSCPDDFDPAALRM